MNTHALHGLAWQALIRLLAGMSAALLTVSAGAAGPPNGDPASIASCRSVSAQTCLIAGRLGRGINLPMLAAPREGDSGWRVEPRFVDAAASHFGTVRLPVRWSNHASLSADATIDPEFLARVDSIVDMLLKKGVYVILDFHNYSQLTGHALYRNERGVEQDVVRPRFINLWRQLAEHYQAWPRELLFEIYNEPYGKLEGGSWNELLAQVLPEIRRSNPDRALLIGPGQWNAPKALPALKLPADPNVIVTVHVYDPFEFTHQGADWVGRPMPTGINCCDATQRAKLTAALDIAKRWSEANGYPIHVGEFGSIEHAPPDARAEYTRLAREEMERRRFSWTYWELAHGFRVFDPATSTWRSELLDALTAAAKPEWQER